MNRQMKKFGMGTILINDFAVHFVNIRVNSNWTNQSIADKHGLKSRLIIAKVKGKNDCKEMLEFKLTTTDGLAFRDYSERVGKVLREIDLTRHKDKYAWVEASTSDELPF